MDRTSARIGVGIVSLLLAACSPETAETTDATDSGTSTDPSEGGSESDATTGEPFEPIPARDVTIVRVEANPGVAVPIGLDGGAVPGAQRNAYIPANRDMLIRVFLDVADDWTPREIEARLTLVYSDGSEVEKRDVFMIEADTFAGGLSTGPYFGLVAEEVKPGLRYRLSLWEAGPGQEGTPEPDPAPRLPLDPDDEVIVGVEDSYQKLRVVLVPVNYSNGGCTANVDPEYWKQRMEDALIQQNPADEGESIIHEPHTVTYSMTSFSGLNNLVNETAQIRAADNPDPWIYYYALFDSCGGCIGSGGGGPGGGGCTVGLAAGITGDAKGNANLRVSAGQLLSTERATLDTFVHEVGHTQGRRHIYCPNGGAAGTDGSYPYDNGIINVWGFGIRDFKLRHPTSTVDYMSYCGPTWCSDWQWNATYQRINKLSSWELEDAPVEPGDGIVIGVLEPDGNSEWWTAPGSFDDFVDPRSANHSVRFTLPGGQVIEQSAVVSERPHYPAINIIAPLPAGLDSAALEQAAISHLHDGGETAVEIDRRSMLHDPKIRAELRGSSGS